MKKLSLIKFCSGLGAVLLLVFWGRIFEVQAQTGALSIGSTTRDVNIIRRLGIGSTSPIALLGISPVTSTEGLRIVASNYSPLVISNSSGADLFRTKEDGNVGIGTSNPQQKLHVVGSILSSSLVNATSSCLYADANGKISLLNAPCGSGSGGGLIGSGQDNYVAKWSGAGLTNGIIYDNGTNVGIGTTTPTSEKLVIVGNIDLPLYNAWRYIKNSATNGGLRFGTGNGSGTYTDGVEISSGANYIKLNHPTTVNGNTNVNGNLYTTGNVGVGTTDPGASKLYVQGTDVTISPRSGSGNATLNLIGYNSGTPGAASVYANWTGGLAFNAANGQSIKFQDNAADNVVIDGNGNVGIATSGPLVKLHVNANGAGPAIRWDYASPSYPTTWYGQVGHYGAGSGQDSFGGVQFFTQRDSVGSTQGFYNFVTKTGTSASISRLVIDGNGNVGIGTTTPGLRLSVIPSLGGQDTVSVNGGFVGGLDLTPFRDDHAVPKGYVDGNFAPIAHKYHAFSAGQYFFDSVSQANYFRLFTENSFADLVRFQPISNVEYYNGSSWVAWTGGEEYVKLLLDGREDTGPAIDHTHRKFRFTVTKNTGWGLNTLVVLQGTWTGITYPGITMGIENWDGSGWVVKDAAINFSAPNTANDHGVHTKVVYLHDGYANSRITVDINDWTDNGSYTTIPLRRLMILSNFSGYSIYPWKWNYDKEFSLLGSLKVLGTAGSSFTGNVGIGTVSPRGMLDIKGNSSGGRIDSLVLSNSGTSDNSATAIYMGYQDGGLGVYGARILQRSYPASTRSSDLLFQIHGTPADNNDSSWNTALMIQRSSGNVGVGTTTPTAKLHIDGGIRSTSLVNATSSCLYADANGAISLLGAPCGSGGGGVGDNLGNHTASQNVRMNGFWLSNDGGDEGVFVKTDGKVGIGTTDPVSPLSVFGTSGNLLTLRHSLSSSYSAMALRDDRNNNSYKFQVGLYGTTVASPNTSNAFFYNTAGGGIGFYVGGGNPVSDLRLLISGGGNIGIGTTNPAAKLQIASSTNIEGLRIIASNYSPLIVRNSDNSIDYFRINESGVANFRNGINFYHQDEATDMRAFSVSSDYALSLDSEASFGKVVVGSFNDGNFSNLLVNGNVGIGTTTPDEKFVVSGSGSDFKIDTDGSYPILRNTAGLYLGVATDIFVLGGRNIRAFGSSGSKYLAFSHNNTDGIVNTVGGGDIIFSPLSVEKMRIKESGHVGIGTTNPTAKLTVADSVLVKYGSLDVFSASNDYILLNSGVGVGTATNPSDLTVMGNIYSSNLGGSGDRCLYVNSLGQISAKTEDCGTGSASSWDHIATQNITLGNYWLSGDGGNEGVFVKSDGNVGIGKTTPQAKLDVSGIIKTNSAVISTGASTWPTTIGPYTAMYYYTSGDAGRLFAYNGSAYKDLAIGDWSGGNPNIMLKVGGKVGIGTGSPANQLSVVGSADFSGNVGIGTTSPSYKLAVAGDVGATSFQYSSDLRLKTNIRTIANPLEKIMQLRGVSFNWRADDNPSLGLIAQEVEKVFPEIVSGEEFKSVGYGNLVAPLIEAVKEQQRIIDRLEARINILEIKNRR